MDDETARPCPHSRREFCVSACHAATAVALGSVLQSCGGGSSAGPGDGGGGTAPQLSVLTGTVIGSGVSVAADGPALGPVGGAALVRSSVGDFLVAHTAQDAFTALTAVCTHEACTITGFASPSYVCPCHGSRYSTAGQVLNGPATRSLRTFPTQLTGTTLTITV